MLKAVLWSPEITTRGEPSSLIDRGPRRRTSWLGVAGPAGVEEHGRGTSGSPGTWDALRLPLDKDWHGVARAEYPRSPAGVGLEGETNTGAREGTARRSSGEAGRDGL